MNSTKQIWGQKVGLEVGMKGGIKFLSLGLDAKATYETTYSKESLQETMVKSTYIITLANGQVCSATTLQISAQCDATRLLYTNLIRWTSDDGKIKKLTYCGSPEAPYEQNRDFERFCDSIGQTESTAIPLQQPGGDTLNFQGCAYN